MENTISLIERLFGTTDVSYLISMFAYAFVGAMISLLIHTTNRNEDKKFSLKILLKDNWSRIVLNILLILVTIRFSNELLGLKMSEFTALLIGVSYDKLGEFLKNKKILPSKKKDEGTA